MATAKERITSGAPRAPRQPSPFEATTKVTVLVHKDCEALDASVTSLSSLFNAEYSDAYAVRSVHRTRAMGGPDKVPSLSVYIAPKGYEFAKQAEARGVRLDSSVADLLRAVASKMGLDPSDPASINAVAKALASKANA